MPSRQICWLIAVIVSLTSCALVRAQERATTDAIAAPPPGVEKFYWDLSQLKDPKDRAIKGMAERYLNLVKIQEWSDLSGNFKTVARYVKHDPNLTTVTIEIVKGRGAERTTDQKTVPVDKLSKSCQSRVKQIDTMQKKIKEMAKAKPGENGAAPGAGASPEFPGGPMPDARGPEAAAPASATPPAAAAAPDPSASEPDPLGFAEIAISPGGPSPVITNFAPSPTPEAAAAVPTATPAAAATSGSSDRAQWRTSFAAFAANLSASPDPTGKRKVEWGELKELGEMNALAEARPIPEGGAPTASPEIAAISERLGDVSWQLTFGGFGRASNGEVGPKFQVPALPKPLEIQFALDDSEAPQSWSAVPPGTPVPIKGKLQIIQPYKILVKIRMAGAAPQPTANPADERR